MFGKFSLLTCIAAVALIVAAVPAPVAGQVEGYAVVGYGFRSQSSSNMPGTNGPLVRVGALLRVVGPIALGGEIGHYWLGETRSFDRPTTVERDRILAFTFCIEVGKLRSRISPRVTLGVGRNSISTKSVYTSIEGDRYTSASSESWLVPHAGLVLVGKPAGAKLALRAEVRTALIVYWPDEGYWLNSVSLGVAF